MYGFMARSGRKVSHRVVATLGALLFGVWAVTGSGIASSQAKQPQPLHPVSGKTWPANIYQMVVTLPYVQVFDVIDPNKATDLKTPGLEFYYVLPQANWTVDCKYYHSSMGWMYRGTKIDGITEAGAPYDGYYETGYMATILKGGLKVEDVDEICFPGGDAGAPK